MEVNTYFKHDSKLFNVGYVNSSQDLGGQNYDTLFLLLKWKIKQLHLPKGNSGKIKWPRLWISNHRF